MWNRRPLLFGHRGAPATGLPENSMASFARALADGATALESDVHRTRDGHIVISHDPIVQNVTIREVTLAELRALDLGGGERMPTLLEVLAAFRDVPINIDLKQQGIAQDVARLLVEHNEAERVLLASFHVSELAAVRAAGYPGPTGLAKDEVVRLVALPWPVHKLWRLRGARAQVPMRSGRIRFDTAAFVARCHALDVRVDYWTINDVDDARALVAIGADGIMSDDPARVRPALATPPVL
jgi:glycerophosphoryl diester phosphodiesterase